MDNCSNSMTDRYLRMNLEWINRARRGGVEFLAKTGKGFQDHRRFHRYGPAGTAPVHGP